MSDPAFADGIARHMDHLRAQGLIESWRLTRRKPGLGPDGLGEFHLMMEVRDPAQIDRAFAHVATRSEPVEGIHFGVNSPAQTTRFALYRDFPDSERRRGEERF